LSEIYRICHEQILTLTAKSRSELFMSFDKALRSCGS
jgi:hypothetical protein